MWCGVIVRMEGENLDVKECPVFSGNATSFKCLYAGHWRRIFQRVPWEFRHDEFPKIENYIVVKNKRVSVKLIGG